jgi:hypothetical protein
MKSLASLVVTLLVVCGPLRASAQSGGGQDPCKKDEARINPETKTGAEGTEITLNGSPNRAPLLWTQLSGPGVAFDQTSERLTFTAPLVGRGGATLTFRLTATVAGCPVTTAEATVNVTNVNARPSAVATAVPSTVNEGASFTLDGSGSSDPDDDPLTYVWTLLDGAAGATIVGTSPTVSLTAPMVGSDGATLTYRLTVSDGFLSDARETLVTVKKGNSPPEAALDCTSPVPERGDILLDASGSADAEGPIESFAWSQVNGGPTVTFPSNDDGVLSSFSIDAPPLAFGQGDTMTFGVIVTDEGGLADSAECTVKVLDVTMPELTLPSGALSAEATSASGAAVSYTASATDAFDGVVDVTCLPGSGSTFPLGATTVSCSAADRAGNVATGSFGVHVVDTTPPNMPDLPDVIGEATSPTGANVTWPVAYADDLVDGSVLVQCAPPSGSHFALDVTATVECGATDAAGNTATDAFTVFVDDTTPPAVTVPADLTTGATQWDGAAVSYGAASAQDVVDGDVAVRCTPESGSVFGFGANTVTCTAFDAHGNAGTNAFTVTVNPFSFLGFFQPVDNAATNTVKGGATVPVKWKLLGEGGLVITDIRAVRSTKAQSVACGSMPGTEDVIEVTMTGGTVLRYDFTGQQFIFNWQTPKLPGTCWRLDVTFTDETTKSANFKLK